MELTGLVDNDGGDLGLLDGLLDGGDGNGGSGGLKTRESVSR